MQMLLKQCHTPLKFGLLPLGQVIKHNLTQILLQQISVKSTNLSVATTKYYIGKSIYQFIENDS